MTSRSRTRRILWALSLCLLPAVLVIAAPDKTVVTPTPAGDFETGEAAKVEEIYPNFALPKDIFNEGKPFYVAKDPVTGKFDFNTKKTVGIQNDIAELNDVVDHKDQDIRSPNDINQIQPNFHDFLNLPVKYSSSKSVYPLISSSYSNLKYQGNNKHFVSNHKNYSVDTTTTTTTSTTGAPNYIGSEKTKEQPQLTLDASTRFYPSSATIRITTTTTPKPKSPITFRPRFTTTTSPVPTAGVYSTITPSSTSTTTVEPPPMSSTLRIVPKTTRFAFDRMTTRNKYMDIAATRKKFSPAPTTETPHVNVGGGKNITFPTDSEPKDPGFVKFEEDKEQRRTEAPILTTRATRRPPLHYSPTMFQTSVKPSGFKPWKKEAAVNKTAAVDSKVKISEILDSLFQESSVKKTVNRTSVDGPITQQQLLNQQPPKVPEYDGKIQKQEIVKVNPSFFDNNAPSVSQTLVQKQPDVPFPTKSDLDNMMSLLSKTEGGAANQDQYVSFKVEQPNMNMVKFSSVPNMNNVVIAPNTDSASFVLGSQQSVGGSGGYMSVGNGFSKPQYQVGQVINEYPPNAPPEFLAATLKVQPNSGVTNFRFPSQNEVDPDSSSDQIYTGSYNSKVVVPGNSVGATQNKVVVFPPGEKMSIDLDLSSNLKTVGSSLSFGSDAAPGFSHNSDFSGGAVGSNVVVAPTDNMSNQSPPSFQQLPQNLRPPPFRRFNTPNQPSTRPTQPQQLSPGFVYSELKRRQPAGTTQPQQKPILMGDPSLPNILPQFRPNAKIGTSNPSAGPYTPYRQPGYDKRPLMRNDMSNARPPPPPSFSVRRTPLPTRFISRINKGSGSSLAPSRAPYPQNENVEPNRRFFNKMSPNPMQDRMYMQARPVQAPIHVADQGGFIDDYTDGYVGPVPVAESKADKVSLALDDQEYGLSPPQRPQTTADRKATFNPETPKLEPVVTLQMLQFQKGLIKKPPVSFNSYSSAPASSPQYDPIRPQAAALQATAESKNPVYVVYPMKGGASTKMDLMAGHESKESIVIGHRGSQQPTPPVKTPLPGVASSVYQNTPFNVRTDAYQEPILKEKPKPNSFPYALEKPEQPEDDDTYHDSFLCSPLCPSSLT